MFNRSSFLKVLFVCLFSLSALAEDYPSLVKDLNAPLPANLFVKLAELINPAVVNIQTKQRVAMQGQRPEGYRDPLLDMLEQFLGPQSLPPQEALGTGFVIREDGLIITNAHVIEGATSIKIQFSDDNKKFYEAEVIGRDVRTDLALLKIEDKKKKFPTLKFGSSQNVEVGDWVAAFGNPLGLGHTVTKGIISAKGREINELNRFPFLQTDASINPGNSGGPLVDTKGYVIGVNTAIARGQGIGFAIPVDKVKVIIKQLEKSGRVIQGFIGVGFQELDESAAKYYRLKDTSGLLVSSVVEDGPAEKADIRPGDVITRFNSRSINSGQDLVNSVSDSEVGSQQTLTVVRNGKELKKKVMISQRPDEGDFTPPTSGDSKSKSYRGQKAPFDLGFYVDKISRRDQQRFGMTGPTPYPLVIRVEDGSPADEAGLAVGDLVLEVNKKATKEPSDVLKQLKKGNNALRIRRGTLERFIFIETQE